MNNEEDDGDEDEQNQDQWKALFITLHFQTAFSLLCDSFSYDYTCQVNSHTFLLNKKIISF